MIKADATDQFAASDDEWQTASTTWQDKTTLTFTPESAGDHLVIGNAAMAMDADNTAMRGRLNHTTASVTYGDRVWYAAWWFQPFAVMEKLTLAASSPTFKLQFRSNSGTLCYYRDAHILALRLSAFEGHAFASNQAVQSTTSASDTDVLTLTQTPAAVAHAIIAIGSFNTARPLFPDTSTSPGTAPVRRSSCAKVSMPPPTCTRARCSGRRSPLRPRHGSGGRGRR